MALVKGDSSNEDLEDFLNKMELEIVPSSPTLKITPELMAMFKQTPMSAPNQTFTREQMAAIFKMVGLNNQMVASQDQMVICDTNKENLGSIGVVMDGKTTNLLYPKEWAIGNLPRINESNEDFAKDYIKMLLIKEELIEADAIVEKQNRMASLLFRVIMSLVLGYLYNNGLQMLSDMVWKSDMSPAQAKELAIQIVDAQLNDGVIEGENFRVVADHVKFVQSLLEKKGVVSESFQNAVFPNLPGAPIEQNYETLLEMIIRISEVSITPDMGVYIKTLQRVCSSIKLILEKSKLIKTFVVDSVTKVKPYFDAAANLLDSDSNVYKMMRSVLTLSIAYNSYGWIFTVIAPFALPHAIDFGKWSLGLIVKMPFSILKFAAGNAIGLGKFLIGYEKPVESADDKRNKDSTLIQIGFIEKIVNGETILIPHMISKGDVQDISRFIANHQLKMPSLLSSIFDGHGVFDFAMQAPHGEDDYAWYLKNTNPIGNFVNCITQELVELTTDDNDEAGHVKTVEEVIFSVFFNTIREESALGGFTLNPLIEIWKESFYLHVKSKYDETVLDKLLLLLSKEYKEYSESLKTSSSSKSLSSLSSKSLSSFNSSNASFKSVSSGTISVVNSHGEDVTIKSTVISTLDEIIVNLEMLTKNSSRASSSSSNLSDITAEDVGIVIKFSKNMKYKSPSTIDLGEKIRSDLKSAESKILEKQSKIINLFDKLVTEDNKYSEYIVYNLLLHFINIPKKITGLGEGAQRKKQMKPIVKKTKKQKKPLTKRILLKKRQKMTIQKRRKRSKKLKN